MKTITLNIDDRSNLGKSILDLLISTSKESNAVEFVEKKSTYSPEFTEMLKESQKQIKEGKYKVIDTNDVWGSIGL
jgi:hypothetical protein